MAELDFEKCIRDGDNQAMNGCESYIGMTLAEAIEKQIPKAPVYNYFPHTGKKLLCCPICDNPVESNYCADCGQRIDWEAVDDE